MKSTLKGFLLISIITLTLSSCVMGLASKMFILEADRDNDGQLNYEEFFEMQKNDEDTKQLAKGKGMSHKEYAKQEFNSTDLNQDGKLSKEEFTKYLKQKRKELK